MFTILKEGIKAIGKAVVEVVKEVAMAALPELIAGAKEFISNIWNNLSEVGNFDEKEAPVEEVVAVNEILEKCIEDYKDISTQYDRDAKEMLDEYYQKINDKLREINEEAGETLISDYVFETFKNEYKHLNKDLDNIYSKEIANGFSLNNSRLLEILKLESNSIGRNKKLSEFTKSVIKKANNKIEKGLTDCFEYLKTNVSENLDEHIKNKKENISLSMGETENILKKLAENKENKSVEEEKYNKIINEIDSILEILDVA